MLNNNEEQEWADWEDAGDDRAPPTAVSSPKAAPPIPRPSSADDGGVWQWDMTALEANVAEIEESCQDCSAMANTKDGEEESSEGAKLRTLADAAPSVMLSLQQSRRRLLGMAVLAKVTKLHLLAARSGFASESGELVADSQIDAEVAAIARELQTEAQDWGSTQQLEGSAWAVVSNQTLQETMDMLQQALQSGVEPGDTSLFQEVIEQVFASLPDQMLCISVDWVRHNTTQHADRTDRSTYLSQLVAMANGEDAAARVPVLSEAEIFQDAKDIGRDELVVNGEHMAGTIGYDAIVDQIHSQLEQLMTSEVGKSPQKSSMQLSDTLHRIAMEVLNASNRTESGGSAYEVLGRFLTNHEMDHVLIRPDSAKAAPIQIDVDIGPFLRSNDGTNETTDWCFGLRVVLSAVTWYLVCDATDPTSELYEIKATYRNRLAFPVGLTPFHPINHMRKDRGVVAIQLVLPTEVEDGDEDDSQSDSLKANPSAIDFDELL